MLTSIVIILIAIIVFISIALVIIIVSKKNKGKENIKQGVFNHKTINGKYYWFRINTRTNKSKRFFNVLVNTDTKINFKISKETKFNRFFVKRGITSKIITNDFEFDERFYIASNMDNQIRNIFSNSKNREIIKKLFNEGFTDIILKRGKLTARIFPYKEKVILDEAKIEIIAKKLFELSDNIQKTSTSENIAVVKGIRAIKIIAFSIPILLEIFSLVIIIIGFVKYKPLDTGTILFAYIKYSIIASIVYIWFITTMIKGRSNSHRELILIFFLTFSAFPLTGAGVTVFLNGYLDKSEPSVFTVSVINKYYTRSKNGKHYYYIKVRSWRKEEISESLSVSCNVYNSIINNKSKVKIITKKGYYNFEWIVRYQILY